MTFKVSYIEIKSLFLSSLKNCPIFLLWMLVYFPTCSLSLSSYAHTTNACAHFTIYSRDSKQVLFTTLINIKKRASLHIKFVRVETYQGLEFGFCVRVSTLKAICIVHLVNQCTFCIQLLRIIIQFHQRKTTSDTAPKNSTTPQSEKAR